MREQEDRFELFRAFEVEELEARMQHVYSYGFGDTYYGCCFNSIKV
jgi:hypothetical protein